MVARLVRLTETYSLDLNKERAQTTCFFLSPTGQTLVALEADMAPELDTRWTAQRQLHSTKTVWLRGRLDEININTGHVVSGLDVTPVTSPGGNSSATTLPCEVSEVLTIRTPFAGPSFRGRMFMPPTSVAEMSAEGQIITATTQSFATAWANFFHAIGVGATDYEAGVYSRKNSAFTVATSVDMGDVYDVMRSRRRSLVEVRASALI